MGFLSAFGVIRLALGERLGLRLWLGLRLLLLSLAGAGGAGAGTNSGSGACLDSFDGGAALGGTTFGTAAGCAGTTCGIGRPAAVFQ